MPVSVCCCLVISLEIWLGCGYVLRFLLVVSVSGGLLFGGVLDFCSDGLGW